MNLTATDNANGTGVTVTISGVSASVSLFAGRVDAGATGQPYASAGSVAGNGSFTVALSPGLWWLYGVSSGVVSPMVCVLSSDGTAKVPTRCRQAIKARIESLGLVGLDGGVIEQIYPDEVTVVAYPCIILTIEGTTESSGPNDTSAADDRGYPTKVMIADRLNNPSADHTQLPKYEAWRYAIERAFAGQFLPGVPESEYCSVEPYQIADPMLPQYQHFVTGLLIRSFCRVPRGLGV
jgi:hypothetical protein